MQNEYLYLLHQYTMSKPTQKENNKLMQLAMTADAPSDGTTSRKFAEPSLKQTGGLDIARPAVKRKLGCGPDQRKRFAPSQPAADSSESGSESGSSDSNESSSGDEDDTVNLECDFCGQRVRVMLKVK